jgi:hypothetical protein
MRVPTFMCTEYFSSRNTDIYRSMRVEIFVYMRMNLMTEGHKCKKKNLKKKHYSLKTYGGVDV